MVAALILSRLIIWNRLLINQDMSKRADRDRFFQRIQEGLGAYTPSPLIGQLIKATLRSRYEGMILIDCEGRIEFMDNAIERFYGLEPGASKGKLFADFFDDVGLIEVAKTGVPQIGELQTIRGVKKIVSRLPIYHDGVLVGAVGKVIFQELDEIKKLSTRIQRLEAKVFFYKNDLLAKNRASYTFESIIGTSKALLETKKQAMRIAKTDATVLLVGESGTGKELFAHGIHQFSLRSNGPFVKVNCATVPFDLAESELFGYEAGAFTGANKSGQKGKFELASGGTIFLDEISTMPLAVQAKLLRIIQEKEVSRIGSAETKQIDFRLIAATNIDLSALVTKGSFRADLYYRLTSMPIYIPPLRERREDIPLLALSLLPRVNERLRCGVIGITDEALGRLMSYDWPGNVRELINVMEQSVLHGHPRSKADIDDLPAFINLEHRKANFSDSCIRDSVAEAEKEAIRQALRKTKGNKRQAAALLGISRAGLYEKIHRLKIQFNDRG